MKVNGNQRLTAEKAGSVKERITLTIGLYGSGLTQDKMAEIMTTQKYNASTVFNTYAIACSKFAKIGI
jgi:hypothetical protein